MYAIREKTKAAVQVCAACGGTYEKAIQEPIPALSLIHICIVGVVVLLCLMVFRNADLGIHTGQSTMLLALFFVIMTV